MEYNRFSVTVDTFAELASNSRENVSSHLRSGIEETCMQDGQRKKQYGKSFHFYALPLIGLQLKRTGIMLDADPYILSFFKALFLTLMIEYVVFSLLNRGLPASRITASVLLVNLLTLSAIWFLFANLIRENLLYIFLSEMFAVFSEGITLGLVLPISYKRGLLSAVIMNLASFAVGSVLLS